MMIRFFMYMVMAILFSNINSSVAEDVIIGEATFYDPPSHPKNCGVTSLANDGMYAHVSRGIWADGASYGQIFEVNCLAVVNGSNFRCANGTKQVEVVGEFTSSGKEIFRLSSKAMGTITEPSNGMLNAEPFNGMIITAEFARRG